MPECVVSWIKYKDPARVSRIQKELIEVYENDFSKHNGNVNSGRILMVFRSIVSQLAKSNEKFMYSAVREGARARDFEEAIEWCRQRGVFFYSVNKDYPEEEKSHNGFSRKLKVDLFIDDRNLGGLPDWGLIYQMIKERKTFRDIYTQGNIPAEQNKKKKWWF